MGGSTFPYALGDTNLSVLIVRRGKSVPQEEDNSDCPVIEFGSVLVFDTISVKHYHYT